MAIVLFSWGNHVDSAVELTATNSVEGLPARNLQNPVVAKFLRTSAASQILVDFGENKTVQVLVFAQPYRGTLLDDTATVRWRLDADGGTPGTGDVYDSTDMPPQVLTRYGYHLHLIAAPVQARYLTLDVSVPADIGRLWAGEIWRPSINMSYGWSRRWVDGSRPSPQQPASLIQYVDEGERAREIQIPFDFLNESDAEVADDFLFDVGIHRQFLLCIDSDNWQRNTAFGRLVQPPPTVESAFGIHAVGYTFIESR